MIEDRLEIYTNNEKRDSFINYDLERITMLLDAAGNPHKSFPSIHVAGTNGKGTVSWALAGILQNAGYKTGLYTSPHLVSVNERIRINNTPVTDNDFTAVLDRIENLMIKNGITGSTYFEILTAAAFVFFSEQRIDAAVIETGLGGRLDSTNVIDPVMSIITDISLDHTAILGSTIEKIAAEKAGIIKRGRPVLTSNSVESGLAVITETAQENGSEIFILGKDFMATGISTTADGTTFSYSFREHSFDSLFAPLLPAHQARNCSIAVTAALMLAGSGFGSINPGVIRDTLKTVKVPGRYEKLCSSPVIIFDPAHNISGITALVSHLEHFYRPDNLVLVISLMKDKATPELIEMLRSLKFPVIYYTLHDPRAFIPGKDIFQVTTDDHDVILQRIMSDNKDRTFVFTGTFRNYAAAVKISSAACKSVKKPG